MGERHLELLRELIEILERYARTVDRRDLELDRESWLKVKAALETAAQCAIDVALQIVALRSLGAPQSYRDAFAILARAGVIEADLAQQLEGWAGLRNVLAHLYTTIDLDRMHGALSETSSLRAFHRAAAAALVDD